MKKLKRWLFIIGAIFIIGLIARIPIVNWANNHVEYMTGGVPHPINCLPCHVYPERDNLIAKFVNKQYLSPFDIVSSSDGNRIFVTAQDSDALLVVDRQKKDVIAKIKIGDRPHSVAVKKDGKTGYVSNEWSDYISVIDLENFTVTDSLFTGGGPAGITLSPEEDFLYVANAYTSDISVFELETNQEIRRLIVGNNPTGTGISPDGKSVFVTSRRTIPKPFRTEPKTEFTILDTKSKRIKERKLFTSAHIMENVASTPSGDLTFVTMIRPKNLVPSVQIESGWMINHGIGVIESGKNGRMVQLLLDEPNTFYADPFDVIVSPDGKRAFVSHSGVNVVSVIDIDEIRKLLAGATPEDIANYANDMGLSSRYVIKRIPTGANPKSFAFSPDGKILYLTEMLEDRIAIIDTELLEVVDHINLGGPGKVTMIRKGEQLFKNAGHTFHNQYSCYSCHPDGHEDGLTYDLTGSGRNLANVQTLRDLNRTSPFKWNGKNTSVYMQCGVRFSKFVTRTESFAPDDLNALVGYILHDLTHPPNFYQNLSGELTPAQQRGKEIYDRTVDNYGLEIPVENRCITCHPAPNFTNRMKADVGTLKDTDDPMLFDSPNLNNVYESAPYLHDGSAATLEEIWTKYNDHDEHGVANDMTKDQLNDLIEYLKCLGPAHTYKNLKTKKAEL
ncbi:MAG: beta-propeller fold lactonase family protein [Bacteroidetes bacterium]|nr:beta-propeller fold lactonase family protein [Bacteroidota bacterium]